MSENIRKLLDRAWAAYDSGKPFMSDADFDALSIKYDYNSFGTEPVGKKGEHLYPMYSLKKVFDDEPDPYNLIEKIESPKLDGTAISLLYEEGHLVQALRRGRDGIEGEFVTDKMMYLVPSKIPTTDTIQINGEVVCDKSIDNARNYASGAFGLKDIKEFETRVSYLEFVAYGILPSIKSTYIKDMVMLDNSGFKTVLTPNIAENFRTDGTVYRENNNSTFERLGYTAKHPKGAFARKQSSAVASELTVLTDVIWQVGRTGKVSPVAIFEEVTIEDAKITRATLHNPGFIEEMELSIGDTIIITRSGGIIPKVLGKV